MPMLNLPNTLTLLRVVAIPGYLICLTDGFYGAALCIFVAAALTDAFDGALARLTDTRTDFGALMDPLADKLLMVSSFVVLAWWGAVPVWLTILVLSRDAVILLGYLATVFVGSPMEIRPSALGKTNTFFEIFTVGFALLALARPDLPLALLNQATQAITAVTTVTSGMQYVYRGLLWQQGQTPAAR